MTHRTNETLDARIKVPSELPQWIQVLADVPAAERVFVRLHDVIRENAHTRYPGMRLTAPTLFRLTRDAEVEMNEDGDQGLRELVREHIRQRQFEPAVRLEFAVNADDRIRQMLQQRFKLANEEVYELAGELNYTSLFEIAGLDAPGLRDAPWTPVTPGRLDRDVSIFDTIRAGDLLVHHPYESFDESVERFISTAAQDADTVAIKMTVYRLGDDTPFVRSLIQAAEAGKQVACVMELKARFDEERNLHWAAELERAGAHVTVGEVNLKTHGFCCLRPGVAGFSESIRIRSIIGRFLEHSRIFYFAAGSADPLDGDFFIGSGDWMFRNLSSRVEVAAPVRSRSARERLWEILDVSLKDRRQAWVMDSDGGYTQLRPQPSVDWAESLGTHQTFIERTKRRHNQPG